MKVLAVVFLLVPVAAIFGFWVWMAIKERNWWWLLAPGLVVWFVVIFIGMSQP